VNLPADEDLGLLEQALHKAQRLLQELIDQQAEVNREPPKIPPRDLVEGRQALQNAIASARRTVAALADAMRTAQKPKE
jgi:hypothetical protein